MSDDDRMQTRQQMLEGYIRENALRTERPTPATSDLVEAARARADGLSTIWNDHSLFAALADALAASEAELAAHKKALGEAVDLRTSVIAFGAPWAVAYAKDFGLAPGELHPTHYDILANAGARMDDFRRAHLQAPDEAQP